MKKFNSHCDAISDDFSFVPFDYSSYVSDMPVTSQKVVNGVIVDSVEYKSFSPSDLNRQYSYTDFELSNLIAIGAYKESSVSMDGSVFDVVDKL